MPNHYVFLALDLAHDRAREAARVHRLFQSDTLTTPSAGIARRSLARAAAALSRRSASVARRLDDSISGEDLDCDCLPA